MYNLKLSSSETETLTSRGYQLLSKIGEGAYSQAHTKNQLLSWRELNILMAIKSPHIVHIHSIFRRNLKYFIFMRYAENGNLMDWIIANGAVPQIQSKLWTKQIVAGMQYLHNNYIAHREIKCENILITARNNIKLTDFGFSSYAENGNLMDWIIANGAVPQIQSKLWTKQIVAGMQYLHNNYIAHREIKCENILITARNNIKLTDFGFSRYIIENDSKVSFSETYCGSLLYVAPEIVKGVAYNPFKSDMWSLGVVIFTMVNCRVPFNETNPSLIYDLQMCQKYRFKDRDPMFAEVKNLIKRLLQPDPKRRPSIDDVLEHKWLVMDTRKVVDTELKDAKTENKLSEDKKTCEPQMKEPTDSSLDDILKTDASGSDDTTKYENETAKPDGKVEQGKKSEENVVVPSIEGIQVISKSIIDDDK